MHLVSISEGCETPGIDNVRFLAILKPTKINSDATKLLNCLIKKLKYDISLSESKTNQAIYRKSLGNLNAREKYRRFLKSVEGKSYIKTCREQYRSILKNPKKYLDDLRSSTIKKNTDLKFKLLNTLKPMKIKNYSSYPIRRVWIPKTGGKLKPLRIPTLKDRTIQTLLKLVMEPYMEPLGDRNSFGFRPGRNCHQAISYLAKRLSIRKSSIVKNERVSPSSKTTLKLQTKRIANMKGLNDNKRITLGKI